MKENIKAPRHWPLCGEFTGTGEFPTQMASNAENVPIWWRHHDNKHPITQRREYRTYLDSTGIHQNSGLATEHVVLTEIKISPQSILPSSFENWLDKKQNRGSSVKSYISQFDNFAISH